MFRARGVGRAGRCAAAMVAAVVLCTGQDANGADWWTWKHGANYVNALPNYGTQGVYAAGNVPGSRFTCMSWTGSDGKLYLFGGYGYDSVGTNSYLGDLWCYNPATGYWAWLKGPNVANVNGVYGTQGTPAPGNYPGCRWGAHTWTDPSTGFLYLFGGDGYPASGGLGQLNDLWRYDPSTNQWVWLKGANVTNQYATPGTQGTPAPANTPGGRGHGTSWTGNDGLFYLFAGFGYGATVGTGGLNDVWRYNPADNQWVWLKGSSEPGGADVYGTKGVAADTNTPGCRMWPCSWIGPGTATYVFGGRGFTGPSPNYYSDLWRYDASTNQWTWVHGSSFMNQGNVYGTQGMPSPTNVPCARYGAVTWSGNDPAMMYLFGGSGYSGNTLWRYNPSTNEFTWVQGTNDPSNAVCIYGTLGVPDTANMPGYRERAVAWTVAGTPPYLFGGYGAAATMTSGRLNDLWHPLAVPAAPSDPGVTNVTTQSLTWTWTDNSDDETGFKMYSGEGTTAPDSPTFTTAANADSFTTTGLSPNTQYAFQVASTSGTTDSLKTTTFTTWTLAATPHAPTVVQRDDTSLDVTPSASDGNGADTEYAIRNETAGNWMQADGSGGASPVWRSRTAWETVTATGLTRLTTYSFTVAARNGAGIETAAGPAGACATLPVTFSSIWLE